MSETTIANTKQPLPPLPGNVSSLVPTNTVNTLSKSTTPQTFGDQIPKLVAQQVLIAATKSKLANLYKEKANLILEDKRLDIQHQITLSKLEKAKTPKKQIQNGQTVEIPAELTEEEYQAALIVENGGTLPNGQQIKGNYPTAKENLQKRKEANQKAIDDILKDPFKSQKDQLKKLKNKLKKRNKKTKEEKRAARKKLTKTVLQAGKKFLVPIITVFLVNKIAEVIAQNDRIGKLVDDTNAIITEANLSNDPIKLQNAKLARDNALRIITSNEEKIRRINGDIQRISTYITIFNTIVNIIGPTILGIPVPTPADVITPVKERFRRRVYETAVRILNGLTTYLPTILLSLEKAIQILNDYKSQLLNINGEIDNAATSSNLFITDPTGTNEFPEYKGFKFAIKEEENSKFVVRGFKRRYAVAIDKRNIEVLKSEFSFTLDPNDLIEQLKLIIDQQNLSADTSVGSARSIGSVGSGGTNISSPQFQISTPSSSDVTAATKAITMKPPEPRDVQGPTKTLKENIPLSNAKKLSLRGLALSPLPNIAIDANFILKEDKKWQAEYKRYRDRISNVALRLES